MLRVMGTCSSIPRGGGNTSYNGLYGEAPPGRGTFSGWKRVGKTNILVSKKVFQNFLKHLASRYLRKGCHFLWKVYERGTILYGRYICIHERDTISVKMVFKRVRVWTLGQFLPYKTLLPWVPPSLAPPPGSIRPTNFKVCNSFTKCRYYSA